MSETVKQPKVAGLYNVCDLQRVCQESNLTFTAETNRYLLYHTIKKVGPILAQKLVKRLVDKGDIEWDKEEQFEVESIRDYYKEEDGRELFLIKWKGWSNEYNTWEPREHLDCEELVESYLLVANKQTRSSRAQIKRKISPDERRPDKRRKIEALMEQISKAPEVTPLKLLMQSPLKTQVERFRGLVSNGKPHAMRRPRAAINNTRTKAHRVYKEEILKALQQWEKRLNEIERNAAPIFVENKVDLDLPPETFTYINNYKAGEGVEIPDDPIVGCECEDCFENKKQCCGPNAGVKFAYYKSRKVRVPPGTPIYECNKRCSCGRSCPNRVVQHGRKHKVCIFKTNNGRGWGVKAMQRIKAGSFVMEYIGEVITNEEAERRGKNYDSQGRTYLFDLDYNDGDCPYTVDAGKFGNVAHFVNHSCDPNLAVYGVWINHLDPRLPRISLFAKRDIDKEEELTFDYMMTGDTTQHGMELPEETPTSEVSGSESNGSTGEEEEDSSEGDVPIATTTASTTLQTPAAEGDGADAAISAQQLFTASPDDENQLNPDVNQSPDVSHSTDGSETAERPPRPDLVVSGCERSESGSPVAASAVGTAEEAAVPTETAVTSPSPALKNRMMCQCGASNCRGYLF